MLLRAQPLRKGYRLDEDAIHAWGFVRDPMKYRKPKRVKLKAFLVKSQEGRAKKANVIKEGHQDYQEESKMESQNL